MRDFHQPRRSAAVASEGMAATSHPLATLTALDVLRAGGNALDAAIAAVAMLGVVEPQSTGIGGDCFCLYSPQAGAPIALNGSGRAPHKARVEWYVEHGMRGIAPETPHAVTVPGAVDAWCRLNEDHGRKTLAELLEPAARYAEAGVAISPRVAHDFAGLSEKIARDPHRSQGVSARRPLAAIGRHPEAAGAGGDLAAHRQGRARRVLSRAGRGGDRGAAQRAAAGCIRSTISPSSGRTMSRRSRPTIAARRCSNVRRTGRGSRR